MFRIKICGITRPEDAAGAVAAGADAIGLNFYPPSPRAVTVDRARQIVERLQALDAGSRELPAIVGVFVNSPTSEIVQCVREVGLTCVQFHGDEPAGAEAALEAAFGDPLTMVRAVRLRAGEAAQIEALLLQCDAAGRRPDGVLVDAATPGAFGGTGELAPWDEARALGECLGEAKLVLAGGLKPTNVAAAIRAVRPFGVDTASGVESSPGVKSRQLMEAFVAAARGAW